MKPATLDEPPSPPRIRSAERNLELKRSPSRRGASLVAVLVLLSAHAAAAARAQDPARPLRLRVSLSYLPKNLNHVLRVSIDPGDTPLERIHRVEYRLRTQRLPAAQWRDGEPGPPEATTKVIVSKGKTARERRFTARGLLGWLPAQVVAVATVEGPEGVKTAVPVGPFDLINPSPSLRPAFRAIYDEQLVATATGLKDIPNLTALEFKLSDLSGRMADGATLDSLAIGLGRSGELMGVYPDFERFPLHELRRLKGVVRLRGVASRRGLPTLGVGDRRDFIWVIALDTKGRAESYATWRPAVLHEELKSPERLAARRSEELYPFARVEPIGAAP